MNHRERLLAALRRRPVDRPPLAPFFNPLTEPQRAGRRWQFPFGPSDLEMARYCVEELEIGPALPLPVGDYHPNFFMSLYYRPGPGVSARVWAEGDVLHKVWSTPAGDLRAAVRYDERWPHGYDIPFYSDFNVAHFVTPWLKNEADLACLRYILRPLEEKEELERVRFEARQWKVQAERLGLATIAHVGMGLTGALQLCGGPIGCA